jgi:hypothetical protein
MHARVEPFGITDRDRALDELGAELAAFHHDALVQLVDDLLAGSVVRGSWSGCVFSYRRGAPGSVRRDRRGRVRNAFTTLWDHGWITDEEVCAAAACELARRSGRQVAGLAAAGRWGG